MSDTVPYTVQVGQIYASRDGLPVVIVGDHYPVPLTVRAAPCTVHGIILPNIALRELRPDGRVYASAGDLEHAYDVTGILTIYPFPPVGCQANTVVCGPAEHVQRLGAEPVQRDFSFAVGQQYATKNGGIVQVVNSDDGGDYQIEVEVVRSSREGTPLGEQLYEGDAEWYTEQGKYWTFSDDSRDLLALVSLTPQPQPSNLQLPLLVGHTYNLRSGGAVRISTVNSQQSNTYPVIGIVVDRPGGDESFVVGDAISFTERGKCYDFNEEDGLDIVSLRRDPPEDDDYYDCNDDDYYVPDTTAEGDDEPDELHLATGHYYCTRDGEIVHITRRAVVGDPCSPSIFPYVGRLIDGYSDRLQWRADGRFHNSRIDDFDLVRLATPGEVDHAMATEHDGDDDF